MSNRLNKERESSLEPQRIEYAYKQLKVKGVDPTVDGKRIAFMYNGALCYFYPYSGWATGKTIIDGRGIENLLKQL